MVGSLGADCPLNDPLADTRRTHSRPEGGRTASALATLSEGQRQQAMDRFAMVRPPNFTPRDAPRSTRRRQAARRPTAATTPL